MISPYPDFVCEQTCLCEEPAGDEAISRHNDSNGRIAAPFGLAMTVLKEASQR